MDLRIRLQKELAYLEWAISHNQQTIVKINKELDRQIRLASDVRQELRKLDEDNGD